MPLTVTYTKCVIESIQTDPITANVIHHMEDEAGEERKSNPMLAIAYDNLSEEDKKTWDAYWAMMQGKCNAEHGF